MHPVVGMSWSPGSSDRVCSRVGSNGLGQTDKICLYLSWLTMTRWGDLTVVNIGSHRPPGPPPA
jgi:hypothetical protein